jgi:poly-gamma-glutamate capsule biosynthesis protein CapA/YwtB (metallophosphatase superfamily)
MGGAMGYNPLRVTPWNVVTPEQLASLKSMQDMILAHRNDTDVARAINLPKDAPGHVTVFDGRYMTGGKPGSYHYELNKGDVDGNLLAIRNTKEYADFAIFTMHVHQNRYAYQAYSNDHYPPDYLQDFAHKLIDNGADMFLGHGNHTMQGIEIYKGRPIFYNLGNFAVHEILPETDNKPEGKTAVESDEMSTDWLQQPDDPLSGRQAGRDPPAARRPGFRQEPAVVADEHRESAVAGPGGGDPGRGAEILRALRHADHHRERRGRHPAIVAGRPQGAAHDDSQLTAFVDSIVSRTE